MNNLNTAEVATARDAQISLRGRLLAGGAAALGMLPLANSEAAISETNSYPLVPSSGLITETFASQIPASRNPVNPTAISCGKAALKRPASIEAVLTRNNDFQAVQLALSGLNKGCDKFGKRSYIYTMDAAGKANTGSSVYKIRPKAISSEYVGVGNRPVSAKSTRRTVKTNIYNCDTPYIEQLDVRGTVHLAWAPKGKKPVKNIAGLKKVPSSRKRTYSSTYKTVCEADKSSLSPSQPSQPGPEVTGPPQV